MSVHSNDGFKTWLTKLDRIGELSASSKDIVFNNLGHIIDANLLKELYFSLNGKKAVGVDKVTKEAYGLHLNKNIECLLNRLRRGTYKPKPARITEIPKEDGSTRPLAISCFEDKLVQLAISAILGKIYEPLFLNCSYGFRPERGCHDAIKALNASTLKNWNGAVVEIDIKKYFNRIPHDAMMRFLRHKISDKRFLRLIDILMTTAIMEGKKEVKNSIGCPQGSIVSPILANIYLHYVVDLWFNAIGRTHIKGRAEMVRYADDMVFTFESMSEAKRFYKVLPKRLTKFGLEMHEEKSSILPAGHNAAKKAKVQGQRLPTFNFLGFTCYWGISRKGYWTLRFSSRRDRFTSKLKGMKEFLRKNLNTPDTPTVINTVIRVIRGWVNYHYISYNERRVKSFIEYCKHILLQWFNRRGGRKRMYWAKFVLILKFYRFPTMRDFRTKSVF